MSHTGEGGAEDLVAVWYVVHETGCLSSPNLVLEPRRVLGELLDFSLHGNPEELSSNVCEGVSQPWDR